MALHQTSGRWGLGLGLAIATTILWGILPIALAIVLETLDVYTVTAFRFFCAFGLLALYLVPRGQWLSLRKLSKQGWSLMAIATVFLCCNYVLFLQGLKLTSPTIVEVLIQLAPVLFGLFALIIFRERYTRLQTLGVAILVFGLALFFHEQLNVVFHAPGNYLLGNGLIIIASATWAIYALAQKQLLNHLSSSEVMWVIYAGCALLLLPTIHPLTLLQLSSLQWGMLLFCGFNTLLAYGAFSESLAHLEASRVSAILALTPLVTMITMWGVETWAPTWVDPESISWMGILGALFVVLGSMMTALGKASHERSPKSA
jgi:drug/metabolite transporter (DMT)-like permease